MVALRGVTLRYGGGPTVLDGVDLEVRRGEIVALIGPSGCGKTSLLNVIMGLLDATEGELDVHAARQAMVFQKPQLLPWRSVVDNAAFGLECRGTPLVEARGVAREMLERMGLGDALDAPPHTLSEGMKQRVNLARALLVDPELLLMDEPYAALDAMTRERLWDELLALWRERELSVIFASHDLDEVVFLADRVVVLSDKPTRIVAIEDVDLPRPRSLTGEGAQALHERAVAMRSLIAI